MELSKLALAPKSKVLVVDDFLRNGGTIFGLLSMLEEFECQLAGVCVFAENTTKKSKITTSRVLMKIQMIYNRMSILSSIRNLVASSKTRLLSLYHFLH